MQRLPYLFVFFYLISPALSSALINKHILLLNVRLSSFKYVRPEFKICNARRMCSSLRPHLVLPNASLLKRFLSTYPIQIWPLRSEEGLFTVVSFMGYSFIRVALIATVALFANWDDIMHQWLNVIHIVGVVGGTIMGPLYPRMPINSHGRKAARSVLPAVNVSKLSQIQQQGRRRSARPLHDAAEI